MKDKLLIKFTLICFFAMITSIPSSIFIIYKQKGYITLLNIFFIIVMAVCIFLICVIWFYVSTKKRDK